MSLLTPLYVLGALAVVGPILFHLIRRRPRGETTFSSLMFLSPSPPRLTRRSRLDNLLLLLLRSLALVLIATAFARPFLRSSLQLGSTTIQRRTVILLDNSASMRREGIWSKALEEVKSICADSSDGDQLALVVFSDHPTTVLGFNTNSSSIPVRDMLTDSAKGQHLTWRGTDLGKALIFAAQLLQDAMADDGDAPIPPQVVVVSDGQHGAALDALDGFQWPQAVPVDLRLVSSESKGKGNAFLSLVESNDEPDDQVRIRVQNVNSPSDTFRLEWLAPDGQVVSQRETQIPPAQSRVIGFDRSDVTERLRLRGDAHEFDNLLYFAKPIPRKRSLWFIQNQATAPNDREQNGIVSGRDSFYFLQQIEFSNPNRNVDVQRKNYADLSSISAREVPLLIVDQQITPLAAQDLRAYLNSGGNVLLVLAETPDDDQVTAIRHLLEMKSLTIEEATVPDYAILSNIDFEHPLFEPFAEPPFNDFTKIRFWAYRAVSSTHEHAWNVLARFDNQAPALVEKTFSDSLGTLWILTSGWDTRNGQLALSSKFAPLLIGLFDHSDREPMIAPSYRTGQQVAVQSGARVILPTGEETTIQGESFAVDLPGLYQLQRDDGIDRFAVNIPPAEGNTLVRDASELEQRGIPLGQRQSADAIIEHERQLRDVELESQQQLWRFCLVGALVLLGVETWLAGHLATRQEGSQDG